MGELEVNGMKNKFRNITVGNTEYIYRYGWNDGLRIVISLKHNKHCRVELHFPAEEPKEEIQHFWRFYEIVLNQDAAQKIVKLVGPKFLSQMIMHLEESTDIFHNSKNVCIQSAWYLLRQMGYADVQPNWIVEF